MRLAQTTSGGAMTSENLFLQLIPLRQTQDVELGAAQAVSRFPKLLVLPTRLYKPEAKVEPGCNVIGSEAS